MVGYRHQRTLHRECLVWGDRRLLHFSESLRIDARRWAATLWRSRDFSGIPINRTWQSELSRQESGQGSLVSGHFIHYFCALKLCLYSPMKLSLNGYCARSWCCIRKRSELKAPIALPTSLRKSFRPTWSNVANLQVATLRATGPRARELQKGFKSIDVRCRQMHMSNRCSAEYFTGHRLRD